MTVYSIHAFYKDGQREYPLVVAYIRTDHQRKATMWAMHYRKPSRAIRIEVHKSGWLDRFMIWLDLLPVYDI